MKKAFNIRHFKDAADYTKNFIVQSEIDRYLPGGRHFIDDDLINRTLAEADAKPAIIKNELDERITLDQIFAQQTGQWVCPRCETMHPMERTHCFICDYDRK